MFEKVKEIFKKAGRGFTQKLNAADRPIKTAVAMYFLLVVLLVVTYYAAWLYQSCNGEIVMSDLLAVIKEMIGPAMIGFITFIAGCFIDMNNNGIPDKFEEDKTHEKSNLG